MKRSHCRRHRLLSDSMMIFLIPPQKQNRLRGSFSSGLRGGDGGELNSFGGSFRERLYALVPPGTCSCCPLLSNGVDLDISTLLSLLLSCFWCMRNGGGA